MRIEWKRSERIEWENKTWKWTVALTDPPSSWFDEDTSMYKVFDSGGMHFTFTSTFIAANREDKQNLCVTISACQTIPCCTHNGSSHWIYRTTVFGHWTFSTASHEIKRSWIIIVFRFNVHERSIESSLNEMNLAKPLTNAFENDEKPKNLFISHSLHNFGLKAFEVFDERNTVLL